MERFNAEADGSIRQAILIGLGSGFANLSADERKRPRRATARPLSNPTLIRASMAPPNGSSGSGGSRSRSRCHQTARRQAQGRQALVRHIQAAHDDRRAGPGRFLVGSPGEEPERDENEQRHEVEIDYPFAVSACEVTVAQFEEFGPADEARRNGAGDDSPMSFVTWAEAAGYCNWLTGQEKIRQAEQAYPNLGKGGTRRRAASARFRSPAAAFACRPSTNGNTSPAAAP